VLNAAGATVRAPAEIYLYPVVSAGFPAS
jgi:hypothetical protein